jgi:hypothetical protein
MLKEMRIIILINSLPFLLPFYFSHMFHMVFNSLLLFMSSSNLILQYHVDMKKACACYLVLEK